MKMSRFLAGGLLMVARRVALLLLFLGAGLVLVQMSAGTLFAFESTGDVGPRDFHTATLMQDGKVLAAGGETTSICCHDQASAALYESASGNWTFTGSLKTPRDSHTATLLPNGKVLVVGGRNNTTEFGDQRLASAELYDPASGTWTMTGSLTTGRYVRCRRDRHERRSRQRGAI
jgi:hypothetical protein